jgi:hypothetical protein
MLKGTYLGPGVSGTMTKITLVETPTTVVVATVAVRATVPLVMVTVARSAEVEDPDCELLAALEADTLDAPELLAALEADTLDAPELLETVGSELTELGRTDALDTEDSELAELTELTVALASAATLEAGDADPLDAVMELSRDEAESVGSELAVLRRSDVPETVDPELAELTVALRSAATLETEDEDSLEAVMELSRSDELESVGSELAAPLELGVELTVSEKSVGKAMAPSELVLLAVGSKLTKSLDAVMVVVEEEIASVAVGSTTTMMVVGEPKASVVDTTFVKETEPLVLVVVLNSIGSTAELGSPIITTVVGSP